MSAGAFWLHRSFFVLLIKQKLACAECELPSMTTSPLSLLAILKCTARASCLLEVSQAYGSKAKVQTQALLPQRAFQVADLRINEHFRRN
jgi:hypothetical protein